MPGTGQPQGLGALAGPDVEHTQPLPDREAGRYLLREAVDFDLAEEPAGRIVTQVKPGA